ncbi:hypothetical protein H0H93_008979 [Arthromyces matolae]|nr:hypothetical protein H0H93_008979 [Arthromyces matolae]
MFTRFSSSLTPAKEQGANVTAHYNSNKTNLEPLLAEHGRQVQALQADLTAESAVAHLFAQASVLFGPVQVIIVNHAVWPYIDQPVVQMSLDQWKSTMDINLTSPFLVCREYLKGLQAASDEIKEYASILFIGSTSGKFGEVGHADYSASKSGVMYGFTSTLKSEIVKIAPKGRVNCVAPGWVKTPMVAEALKYPDIAYRAVATTPLKKVGLPSDVASQVVILSSPRISGHVSGEVIVVAGGMEGRLLYLPQDM